MKKLLLGIISSIFFVSCGMMGEEIDRVSFKETSNNELHLKETTLKLTKGDKIAFWTDTDIEYEGQLALAYIVEMWKDTTMLSEFQLNALKTNPTMMEIKTTFGNKTSWSYQGKMDFVTIDNDGTYTFKSVLKSSENNTLVLNKSDLVFKK